VAPSGALGGGKLLVDSSCPPSVNAVKSGRKPIDLDG